jgi:hypothetical protein
LVLSTCPFEEASSLIKRLGWINSISAFREGRNHLPDLQELGPRWSHDLQTDEWGSTLGSWLANHSPASPWSPRDWFPAGSHDPHTAQWGSTLRLLLERLGKGLPFPHRPP